jgi:ferredoxin
MKVRIDPEKCTMCMSCVAICPEVFGMNESGIVDVKSEYRGVDITDEELIAKVREAADACPTVAIVVEK